MDDDVDFGIDLSEVFDMPPALTDDSEVLLPGRASDLAKHKGQLILRKLEELEPEIARILIKHRGGTLSLPAVRCISAEAAGIIAHYKGTLRLDGVVLLSENEASRLAEHDGEVTLRGLWILASIPLAKKLAEQWKTQGKGFDYPNITVEVAEALDLWPAATARWPGTQIELDERHKYPGDIGAIQEWQRYIRCRHDLLRRDLTNFESFNGLKIREEAADGSLLASRLESLKRRYCTLFIVTHSANANPQDVSDGTLFEYISPSGCRGPLTNDQLLQRIDQSLSGLIYWPCLVQGNAVETGVHMQLRSGPASLRDVQLSEESMHQERMSLFLLQAAEQYQQIISVESKVLDESFSDFSSVCQLAENMDGIAEMAFALCPDLREIPGCDKVLKCRERLHEQLHSFAARMEKSGTLDDSRWEDLHAALRRLKPAAKNFDDDVE